MTTPTKDDSAFSSPRTEDEHMYDNLESPTFETVSNDAEFNSQSQGASEASARPQPLTPEELEKLKQELEKVENEITTLRQVLGSKVRLASDIKRRMGITPFQELKQDFQSGIKNIKESDTVMRTNEQLGHLKDRITGSAAYQRTNEKIHDFNDKITHSTAYQKTSSVVKSASEKTNAVVSNIGASVSKKLGDIRNSNTFKSMEEKVGVAYSNVKSKVTGSKSEGSFEEALMNEKQANSNGDAAAAATTNKSMESLPEEKVPL